MLDTDSTLTDQLVKRHWSQINMQYMYMFIVANANFIFVSFRNK